MQALAILDNFLSTIGSLLDRLLLDNFEETGFAKGTPSHALANGFTFHRISNHHK